MPLRVVVADDDYLVRGGIAALLGGLTEVEVVATAGGVDALYAAVEEQRPDVVLTDIRMPPQWEDEGIRAAHRIRRDHPDIGVLRTGPGHSRHRRAGRPVGTDGRGDLERA